MSKVRTLREVVAEIENGSHVAFAGFAITRCVVAAAHELVRAGARDLELSQVIGGMDTDLVVGGGCARKLTYSGGSFDRFGPLHSVNRASAAGALEVEEYSSLSLTLRYHAAALGVPFVPTRSMLGSDLLEALIAGGNARVELDPFAGEPYVALAPLRPDFAFVHVDVADEEGNAVVAGPTWATRETAFAARRTIVVAEQVVSVGGIEPGSVTIPGPFVWAVSHVPFAAHPTAACGQYDYDRRRLELYVAAARDGGEPYARYLDEYVLGAGSHEAYLELVGATV